MGFKAKLREQMLKNRIEKVNKNASLDDVYKSMMVQGLHNKMRISN